MPPTSEYLDIGGKISVTRNMVEISANTLHVLLHFNGSDGAFR